MQSGCAPAPVRGAILHRPGGYDALVWLYTLGREGAFRRRILRRACLRLGDAVLDVGCGTGSLAIEAKRQVGPGGVVQGIDASPEMLARARVKSGRAGLAIAFGVAPAQALPFLDRQFDVVVLSLVLHHLPRDARAQCLREVQRVLKPGGRMLAVEFSMTMTGHFSKFLEHFHRHGHVPFDDVAMLTREAGLRVLDCGSLQYRNLQFILAGRHVHEVRQ